MPPTIRITTPELARFVDLPHAHGTVDDLTDEDYRPEAQPPIRCAAIVSASQNGPRSTTASPSLWSAKSGVYCTTGARAKRGNRCACQARIRMHELPANRDGIACLGGSELP